MIGIGLLVGLVYVSCLVLATGLLAAGDRVTYQCSGKSTLPAFPRLDEASVDDLSALQASGAVTCANLVNVAPLRRNGNLCMTLINQRPTSKESTKLIPAFALSARLTLMPCLLQARSMPSEPLAVREGACRSLIIAGRIDKFLVHCTAYRS